MSASLNKRSRHGNKCRILLVVIFLITIGTPLTHPLLHRHSDCDHVSPAPFGEQVRSGNHLGHFHDCPLCGFLATHQLHFTPTPTPAFAEETIAQRNFGALALPIKTPALPVEARAPPSAAPTF